MKKFLFLLLCCFFTISFAILCSACEETPAYYGTYYSLDKNDYITIDSKYAHVKDSGDYNYTANGDSIILENNRHLLLFNNYNVICLADNVILSNNIQCSSRNSYFEGTFSFPNESYLTFYNDGTVSYLYLPDAYAAWQGNYTINSGIINVYGNYVLTNETIAKYYYLDSSLNLYYMALCKDGAEFLVDNSDVTTNNPYTPTKSTQNVEVENNYELSYSFSSELNGYFVSGITGTYSKVVVPSTYKTVPVVAIGGSAFSHCETLKEIIIPESIKQISSWAFYCCENLTKINIPYGVEKIGSSAFCQCKNLNNIVIPDSVTSIFNSAFEGCSSLESIALPNYLKIINNSTFKDCTSLKQITIPNSVNTIYDRAFGNCTSLTNIIIPNSVEQMDYCVFENCTSLTSITIPEKVDIIKYGGNFFEGCVNLKTVYVDSPKIINLNTFADNLPAFATDVYILTDLTPTLSVYTIVYEKQDGTVMHDGKEYYHYKIKE